jgi:site-specific DNA-methyltransferase (adenine-specific)
MTVTLHHGDCLEIMPTLPAQSVDEIIADLPYGTTACKWDTVIPFAPMWECLKRVTKKNAAIVLFGSQPFTSALVMSNVKMFRYEWVWDKVIGRGHLVSKKRPMAQHEQVAVFYKFAPNYRPQMVKKDRPIIGHKYATSATDVIFQTKFGGGLVERTHSYPKTILTFPPRGNSIHPTQKPVALMEYLIKTYTNEGETVLDFTMGSGTTGVACKNLNRKFIGIEKDDAYFKIASERIKNHVVQEELVA